MISRKSQFSIVEIVFLIFLFSIVNVYIFFDFNTSSKDYHFMLESGLDTIYYSENFRSIIIDEDLTSLSLIQDWDILEQTLDNMFPGGVSLILFDETNTKVIFDCTENSGKIFDERLISINSGENFKFRRIRLGVCY